MTFVYLSSSLLLPSLNEGTLNLLPLIVTNVHIEFVTRSQQLLVSCQNRKLLLLRLLRNITQHYSHASHLPRSTDHVFPFRFNAHPPLMGSKNKHVPNLFWPTPHSLSFKFNSLSSSHSVDDLFSRQITTRKSCECVLNAPCRSGWWTAATIASVHRPHLCRPMKDLRNCLRIFLRNATSFPIRTTRSLSLATARPIRMPLHKTSNKVSGKRDFEK